MIFSKPVFQLWPEVPDKTLDWPSSAVSQSADGVALNLFAQFPNHINLLWLCVARNGAVGRRLGRSGLCGGRVVLRPPSRSRG